MIGWDHPDTAKYYEAFCGAHPRYGLANEDLAWHAGIAPQHRVLDYGAGIGHTIEAILPWLSAAGSIVAFEPAAAMRACGQGRVRDPRVTWVDSLPEERFDRILCGAAIWQCLPLDKNLRCLAERLNDYGALAFNVPALYLGEPEPSGIDLMPAATGWTSSAKASAAPPSAAQVNGFLAECGLTPSSWRFRQPLSRAAYRDWLKIPVLNNQWFGSMPPADRASKIDEAFLDLPAEDWRWESWRGWTASKGAAVDPVRIANRQPLVRTTNPDDGYIYCPGILAAASVEALRTKVVDLYNRSPERGIEERAFVELQQAVAVLPEFEAIRSDPAILNLMRRVFGTDVESQCGDVCRVVPPGALPTPPHQDQFFIGNARRVWTVWIPLGDCPLRLGPLAILTGSHRQGIAPHVSNQIADCNPELWWATAAMAAGDVLAFGGCTIHQACPNLTIDETRFSVDFRYSAIR